MDKQFKDGLKPSTSSKSYFGENSGAYPFTNESLSDLSKSHLNLVGNTLVISSAGDIQILISGLGAKSIDSLDISKKANAWADYKWNIFQNSSEVEYRRILVENPIWKNFPLDIQVSEESKRLFYANRGDNEENIYTSEIFKQVKFHGLKINSLGYWGRNYLPFQLNSKGTNLKFHLGSLERIFEISGLNKTFSFAYLSNVLDHNMDDKNEHHDFSKERIIKVLKPLILSLDQGGQIVYNFSWSGRAIPGAIEALNYFGYSLKQIEKSAEGCGNMYLSEKK